MHRQFRVVFIARSVACSTKNRDLCEISRAGKGRITGREMPCNGLQAR
jgi:hypothetical protein